MEGGGQNWYTFFFVKDNGVEIIIRSNRIFAKDFFS